MFAFSAFPNLLPCRSRESREALRCWHRAHSARMVRAHQVRGWYTGLGIGALVLAILLSEPQVQGAEPNRGAEFVLGMSAPFSGGAEDLGKGMQRGIFAALERANRAGGVNG